MDSQELQLVGLVWSAWIILNILILPIQIKMQTQPVNIFIRIGIVLSGPLGSVVTRFIINK